MLGFRKRKAQPDIQVSPPPTSRVEIEVAKDANKEVKQKAKEINAGVKDLLVQNGFTLTIALAASSPAKNKGKR